MVRAFTLATLFALSAAACSPSVEAESGSGTSAAELTDGRRLSEVQVESLLLRVGFSTALVPKMVCIAKYESGFNDLFARGKNNGSWDIGLFAINTVHAGNTPGCPAKAEGLYDPTTNTKCALSVYGMYGLRGWAGYAPNKLECDSYRIDRASR